MDSCGGDVEVIVYWMYRSRGDGVLVDKPTMSSAALGSTHGVVGLSSGSIFPRSQGWQMLVRSARIPRVKYRAVTLIGMKVFEGHRMHSGAKSSEVLAAVELADSSSTKL